tara:strand:- start:2417 stop:3262 length:846 start_codon:yes stop_codon:yes gene_type:complete
MSLNIVNEPWIESPFFYQILKSKKNKVFKKYAIDMHEKGYCVIDLKLSANTINNINKDIARSLNIGDFKTNPKIYQYNKYPRIVEAWKFSKNVAQLANNIFVKKLLNYLYDSKPLPFSTINFIGGSEQPLHSDYIHFGSMPHKYLVGVWVALENTNKDNGPLTVVPGSHKLSLIDYQDLKRNKATNIKELEKNYRVYEKYIQNIIKYKKLKTKQLHIKKGQAIIWAANLLHGGVRMRNYKLTRKSQVIHFHFSKNKFNYNPGFSDPKKGLYVERKLDIVRV